MWEVLKLDGLIFPCLLGKDHPAIWRALRALCLENNATKDKVPIQGHMRGSAIDGDPLGCCACCVRDDNGRELLHELWYLPVIWLGE